MKLRILLVSPIPPPIGGIATWTQAYIGWMTAKNQEILLVNTALTGSRKKQSFIKINYIHEFHRAMNILQDFKKKIRTFQPSIVHINSSCSKYGIIRDYLCVKVAKKKQKKIIVNFHCNIEDQLNTKIALNVFKKICILADLCIVLNRQSERIVRQYANDNVVVLPNFIDAKDIVIRKKCIENDIKQICFLGHVTKKKGFLEIINVASIFPNIRFVVAGPVLEDFSCIDISDNVVITGPLTREESIELLFDSDVFLFPTYTEGFSNALLEAMTIGLPIITTSVGANKEMIDEHGGYLVKTGDYHEIIAKLNLMKNRDVRKNMSNWNRRKVLSNYTIDIVMEQLINFYIKTLYK